MASLQGTQINNTYPGLLKLDDNGAVQPTTLKTLTDGTGGTLPIQVSQVETKFTSGSLVDFTGTTVAGLPADVDTTYDLASAANGANVDITLTGSDASVDTIQLTAGTNITLTEAAGSITIDAAGGGGAAGLVNGPQTDSLKNADALVTTAAITKGAGDIVLGNGASVINSASTDTRPYSGGGVVIGDGAKSNQTTDYSFINEYYGGIAIGQDAEAEVQSQNSIGIAIGNNSFAGAGGIAIGGALNSAAYADSKGVAIGIGSRATVSDAIGFYGTADGGYGSNAIGKGSDANTGGFQTSPTVYGYNARGRALGSVVIGGGAQVNTTANTNCTVVGTGANVAAGVSDAGAFGQGVIAGITGSVSVKELETQTVGGGITMYSPNGTGYKLTVSDAGAPVFTAI